MKYENRADDGGLGFYVFAFILLALVSILGIADHFEDKRESTLNTYLVEVAK